VVGEAEIKLGDTLVPYVIKRSTKAKHVRFSISVGKGLEVVIPRDYPADQVASLLYEREKWILEKLQSVAETAALIKTAREDAGSLIRYLGKEYRVVVILDVASPMRVELDGDKAYITLPRRSEELLRQIIEAWYRWAAKSLFEERVKMWAERIGVSYQNIFVKNQKTRWGSCSKRQNLNLNMRIIMAPLEVVDYLLVHELSHLKEMNHSKRFWSLVEHYCPGYKRQLAWLKKYGQSLTI